MMEEDNCLCGVKLQKTGSWLRVPPLHFVSHELHEWGTIVSTKSGGPREKNKVLCLNAVTTIRSFPCSSPNTMSARGPARHAFSVHIRVMRWSAHETVTRHSVSAGLARFGPLSCSQYLNWSSNSVSEFHAPGHLHAVSSLCFLPPPPPPQSRHSASSSPPPPSSLRHCHIAILRWLVFVFVLRASATIHIVCKEFGSSGLAGILPFRVRTYPSLFCLFASFFFFTWRCRHQLLAKRDDARLCDIGWQMNGVTAPAPSTKSGESPRLDAHFGCRTGEELLLVSVVFPFPKFKLWSMSHHSLRSIRCFHAYLLQYFLFIFRVQLVLNSSLSSGCDCCCCSYTTLWITRRGSIQAFAEGDEEGVWWSRDRRGTRASYVRICALSWHGCQPSQLHIVRIGLSISLICYCIF